MKALNRIEMRNISKSFYNTQALKNVDFTCESGKVHALVGLNGAGKSTLINILGGVKHKDSGDILLNDTPIDIHSPIDARTHGISIIHQEYSLINELSISRNIFLGRELFYGKSFIVNHAQMDREVQKLLDRFELDINPRSLVKDLNSGEKQLVEIIRSLMTDAWLIVMDEPTSALSEEDKRKLFTFIERLKQEKIGIIYITHHMPEIFEMADSVTAMRDGQIIQTFAVGETTENEVISSMIGEELNDFVKPEKEYIGETLLEVKNLSLEKNFQNIHFDIKKGEIVALTGLRGCGNAEIAQAIFGLEHGVTGDVFYKGTKFDTTKGPAHSIQEHIGFVSANRDKDGILPVLSVKDNISLPFIEKLSRFGFVNSEQEVGLVTKAIGDTKIKTASHEQAIQFLSGGNKQKACFARWLDEDIELIILLEPTRGIDIHAKAELYRIIEELSTTGVSILMVSYEVDEVVMLADKVLVLYKGDIVAEYEQDEIDKEKILSGLTGVAN